VSQGDDKVVVKFHVTWLLHCSCTRRNWSALT